MLQAVFNIDSYYKEFPPDMAVTGDQDWEAASAIHWDTFRLDLQNQIQQAIEAIRTQNAPFRLILIEGILIYNQDWLLPLFDTLLFLEIDKQTCRKRRFARDPEFMYDAYFDLVLWPAYLEYVQQIHARKLQMYRLDGLQSREFLLNQALQLLKARFPILFTNISIPSSNLVKN
jgi:uridine kinase